MKFKSFFLITLLVSVLFVSCGREKYPRYYLDDVSWAMGTESDTLQQAKEYNYEPLKLGYRNISDLVGKETAYVWVKFQFNLPQELKRQNLGLVIPFLHFAERCWFNDNFIGQHGDFYPQPYSPMYSSYYYTLPMQLLRQESTNYIYFKILAQGRSSISDGIFISNVADARVAANWMNFNHTRVYVFFAGILICACLFLLILYFAQKTEQKYLLSFSGICASTIIFLAYFFATELPGYSDGIVSHLLFTKITYCCGFYLIVYSLVGFIFNFIGIKPPSGFVIFKRIVLTLTIIITLLAKDFSSLIKLTIPMLVIYIIHFIFGLGFVFFAISNKQKRQKAIIVCLSFVPLVITMIIDMIVRSGFRIIRYPYFTMFGWEGTMVFILIYMAIQYNKMFIQNRRLTEDLQREVNLQTIDLYIANDKLEAEWKRSQQEMDMAAVVQSKFLTNPENNFTGWDIDFINYPLEKISGDLYDFYSENKVLEGLALFDVSGHGIAAGLITMLSKNIIGHEFKRIMKNGHSVSDAMIRINQNILEAKADVDNYLTGLLLKFDYEKDGTCNVQLASGGHPYPIYYNADLNEVINLNTLELEPRYGVVGMKDMEVSYPNIDFPMYSNDILVCFSDGVTEACNEDRATFGRERLEKIIVENHEKSASEIHQCIKNAVIEFRGENPREDDITLIILKRK